jgi:MFS family permease
MMSKFPENREKYLGMGESAAGIGTMLGPVIGSLLYAYFGYFLAFMFFAAMLAAAGILSFLILPNSLNNKFDKTDDNEKA